MLPFSPRWNRATRAVLALGLVVVVLPLSSCNVLGDEYASCKDWSSWSDNHHQTYADEHGHDAYWAAQRSAFCEQNPDAKSFLG